MSNYHHIHYNDFRKKYKKKNDWKSINQFISGLNLIECNLNPL